MSDPQFVAIEKDILSFWQTDNTFARSLQQRQQATPFIIYDGPPFATGLPHHGHLLASTLKDIVPRYQTMRGYYVERRFGWDCHGLPIEHEIDKQYGQSSRSIVEEKGLAFYNDACRSIIDRYCQAWESTVERMGRWVDFNNDYKTMDKDFMESVWWVFAELWQKDLIYRGNKVVAYSTVLETPLSNFEASSNYQMVQDPSLTVRMALVGEEADLLIWTTTPWTLPANMAVCVNPNANYVLAEKANERSVILAEALQDRHLDETWQIRGRFSGASLIGKHYQPLFADLFDNDDKHFQILADAFVSLEDGTGLVHMAPAFGEDDHRVCLNAGINEPFCPIDSKGCYTTAINDTELMGKLVFDANPSIIQSLKKSGLIWSHLTLDHSYPHCPRSDSKLIYRMIPSWFVKVSALQDRLLDQLQNTHWTPMHIRDKRFQLGLQSAPDWAISRNRYWGTPLPIWQNDNNGKCICIGSIAELYEKTGVHVNDLHREHIDHLTFSQPDEDGVYRRIPEVLDCWFESGSMPYAQKHYPFSENNLEKVLPADFIAEGLDQTRGWFYTLHVIACALFDQAAFKHVVVNGIILAADGKKMSKRLKNYTPPDDLLEEHGADALRLYLIASNLVKAEEQRFADDGIKEMTRKVLLPFYHAFSFLKTYADIDAWQYQTCHPQHPLDAWIQSRLHSTLQTMIKAMDSYALYRIVPEMMALLDDLTNTYIRLSRQRFWASDMPLDKQSAYASLYCVCLNLSQAFAPFIPFLSEHIYRELLSFDPNSKHHSVHLCDYPVVDPTLIDADLEDAVRGMNNVLILGRQKRNDVGIKVKTPLKTLTIVHHDQKRLATLERFSEIIKKELNVKQVLFDHEDSHYIRYHGVPNAKVLGARLGAQFAVVNTQIRTLSHESIIDLMQKRSVTIEGMSIDLDEVFVRCQPIDASKVNSNMDIAICLDCQLTDELRLEGLARELVSHIQKQRKSQGLAISDRINLQLAGNKVAELLAAHGDYIAKETLSTQIKEGILDKKQGVTIAEHTFVIHLERA